MDNIDLTGEIADLDARIAALKDTSIRLKSQSTPLSSKHKQVKGSGPRDSGLDSTWPSGKSVGYKNTRDTMYMGPRPSVRFDDDTSNTRAHDDVGLGSRSTKYEDYGDSYSSQQGSTHDNPRTDRNNIDDGVTIRRRKTIDHEKEIRDEAEIRPKPMTNYMKPATYDGTGSWLDYQAHFEACSSINHWTESQKGLYLAASLRGHAQTVLGNMSKDKPCQYTSLTSALEARFAPKNQTELYRSMLKQKRLGPSETIPELGEGIKRLTYLAYPTVSRDVVEMMAKDNFIDALPDGDMRLRIKQSRPKSLNEAVGLAVEIESFCKVERDRRDEMKYVRSASGVDPDHNPNHGDEAIENLTSMLGSLQKSIKKLEKDMHDLKACSKQTQRGSKQRNQTALPMTHKREGTMYSVTFVRNLVI
ncbi:hypothetical protein CI610_02661 [invertebrate metagenome]|uniref:Uncharacterized protein n=1 Tax=invertebrate metagenome TaxID=1711999 RepID=A0A2H9T5C0_9ZZZZ